MESKQYLSHSKYLATWTQELLDSQI